MKNRPWHRCFPVIFEISKNTFFTEHLLATASVFKMQFLSFCKTKYPNFFPAGSFFLVLQLKYSSECPKFRENSPALTNSWLHVCAKWLIYGLLYKKNRFINSLIQHSQNHEHAKYIDFQFHNLKISQKGILDFHVTTATVVLCMKEVIDSLLRIALSRKIIYGHTKSKNLNYHCTKFSQKRYFCLLYYHI